MHLSPPSASAAMTTTDLAIAKTSIDIDDVTISDASFEELMFEVLAGANAPPSSSGLPTTAAPETGLNEARTGPNPFDVDDLSDGDSDDDELLYDEHPQPSVGTVHRTSAGKLAIAAQDIQLRHRGNALSRFSGTEYACCVRNVILRQKNSNSIDIENTSGEDSSSEHPAPHYDNSETDNASDSDNSADTANAAQDTPQQPPSEAVNSGRKPSNTFPYSPDFELHDTHIQRLASLQTVPIFGGINAIPPWPSLKIEHIGEELLSQRAHFAEWVMAVLIPLPAWGFHYEPQHDVLKQFENTLRQLTRATFLLSLEPNPLQPLRGKFYNPPPGYVSDDVSRIYQYIVDEHTSIRTENPDFKAYEFVQQCIARFIGSCASGMRRNPGERSIQMYWRHRGDQLWHGNAIDPERKLFPKSRLMNASHSSAADAVPDAVSEQHGHRINNKIFGIIIDLLRSAGDCNFSGEQPHLSPFIASMGDALRILQTESSLPMPMTAWNNPDLPPIPKLGEGKIASIEDIAKISEALARKDDELEPVDEPPLPPHPATAFIPSSPTPAMDALQAICKGDRPPNAGQYKVLHTIALYADAVHAGQSVQPLWIFIGGEGGTGKSYIYECAEKLFDAINATFIPTALTGVACTSINTRTSVRTTASRFLLGIKPCHIEKLETQQLERFRNSFGKPIAILVDEISFGEPGIIAAVSE